MPTFSQYSAHPWHGVPLHDALPKIVNVFVEIVPTDVMKYEVDKVSGHLKVDRPQSFSNICPTLYGFIPRTYCGPTVAQKANLPEGDGDPLDICVFSERPIVHGNILLEAVPIGGLRLADRGQADDKIIAVLKNDSVYGQWTDIKEVSPALIERLKHYFLTYKNQAGSKTTACSLQEIYGAAEAQDVILRSVADYIELAGAPR